MTLTRTFATWFSLLETEGATNIGNGLSKRRGERESIGEGLTNAVSSCSQTFGITRKRDNCYSDGRTRSSEQKSNSRGGISN